MKTFSSVKNPVPLLETPDYFAFIPLPFIPLPLPGSGEYASRATGNEGRGINGKGMKTFSSVKNPVPLLETPDYFVFIPLPFIPLPLPGSGEYASRATGNEGRGINGKGMETCFSVKSPVPLFDTLDYFVFIPLPFIPLPLPGSGEYASRATGNEGRGINGKGMETCFSVKNPVSLFDTPDYFVFIPLPFIPLPLRDSGEYASRATGNEGRGINGKGMETCFSVKNPVSLFDTPDYFVFIPLPFIPLPLHHSHEYA